jgi:DNA-binding PadR family transcriptional regulator
VIELMILGFLAEGPLHGYELRRRMTRLHGHARIFSDGTVYPAINRLVASGLLGRELGPGHAAARKGTLRLTELGLRRLRRLLGEADGHDITDGGRFLIVLAFLSHLPDEAERRAVLRRRLDFLDGPASFFYEGAHPLRADEIGDPYRRGILVVAEGARSAERAWLRERLGTASGVGPVVSARETRAPRVLGPAVHSVSAAGPMRRDLPVPSLGGTTPKGPDRAPALRGGTA